MLFQEKLKKYKDIVEEELKKYVITKKCPEEKLNESIEYSLISNGKRLRPILILATYTMFKENTEQCMPFCVAMEMIHNFSLIHDDLPGIDNDDYRHGKLTNHKKFGEATAILAGDSLLNTAYLVVSDFLCSSVENLENKIQAFDELALATNQMIIGEYVDTEFEGQTISSEYLEYMHKNKTGALIRASVRIGAILADASEDEVIKLTNYAEKIGLAFQVKDDILSEIGDEKVMGKPVGNDKARGKVTYVSKYGLETAQEMLKRLIDEAIEEIERINKDTEFLKDLALYIKNREK